MITFGNNLIYAKLLGMELKYSLVMYEASHALLMASLTCIGYASH